MTTFMKPFGTLDEADEWMDQNAEGEISVYVEVFDMESAWQAHANGYSIPANGPAKVSLHWSAPNKTRKPEK